MSTVKLAIIYLLWIVIVALSVNILSIYSNFEEPSLSFLEYDSYKNLIEPASTASLQNGIGEISNSAISTASLGIVEFNTDYFIEHLGQFLIPFLLLLMVIPAIFFVRKKNANKVLKRRFSVIILLGLVLTSTIFIADQFGWTNGDVYSDSAKLMYAFLSLACFSYALWLLFSVYNTFSKNSTNEYIKPLKSLLNYFVPILGCLLMIETLLLFMDVSILFPTSPKLGGYWMSPQIGKGVADLGITSLFTQEVSLRFLHKILSYSLFMFIFVMWFNSRSLPGDSISKRSIKYMAWLISFQVVLGIISLFLLDFTFVGILHHLASLVILMLTIRLIALSRDRKLYLKHAKSKFNFDGYRLDVPIIEK